MNSTPSSDRFLPYVPRLLSGWDPARPPPSATVVDGTLVFVDISGFTAMSERLARRGKVGAEEVSGVIGSVFASLLAGAYAEGGSLIKFGGDALLLLFDGAGHAERGVRAAAWMRRSLRSAGPIQTSAGQVRLRMSVGVHSGCFRFYLTGDSHHELIVTGPEAGTTVLMESTAEAGEILLSPATAALLPPRTLGRPKGPGILLRSAPRGTGGAAPALHAPTIDVSACVSPAIRAHVQAGGGEPEHRMVTIAFIRFSGVDALAEGSGDAAVATALHELVTAVQRVCERRSITFLATDADRDGGKIILAAGAPAAAEDDEGRMLRALRDIADTPFALTLRIGVNRGHVFAGDIGPEYRRTFTVMGDAVNLAARLMANAVPGHIYATGGVIHAARTAVEARPLAPLTVKGKRKPVQAFDIGRVMGQKAAADVEVALTGRDEQLAAITAALDATREGRGSVIQIEGEPGSGKSRMARAAGESAAGIVVSSVACDPYESSTPYFSANLALRAVLALPEDDPARRLHEIVKRYAPDLEPWLPLLGTPVGLAFDDTLQTQRLDEKFRRDRTEAVIAELLLAIPARPAVLIFEDAQWMDEASAGLLTRIVESIRSRPWVLFVTRRNEATGFAAPGWAVRIPLPPLSADQSRALIHAATEDVPLRPHQIEAIVARGDGNPLFLMQLVAAAAAGAGDALPDSVEAAVVARIDELAPPDRILLRRVAVLGTAFGKDLAAAVVPAATGSGVWQRLAAFIEPVGRDALRFRNTLVRDAAYEGLPYRTRTQLHGFVAQRIESQSPDPSEHAGILSLHYAEARMDEKAFTYAIRAAERAAAIYANAEAASFFERALTVARRAGRGVAGDLAAVWESLGDVRERMGDFDRAHAAFRSARRLQPADAVAGARLSMKHALIARRAGRYAAAIRWLGRGRALLTDDDADSTMLRARLSSWTASIRQEQGRSDDAIVWCFRAIDEASASGADAALAHAWYVLDWAYMETGRTELANNSLQSLALYERLGDLAGQANVLNNMGGFAFVQGRWDEALDCYRRAAAVREQMGDAVNARFGSVNIAEVLIDQGRLDEAEPYLTDTLRVWKATGYLGGHAFAQTLAARIAAGRGDFPRAAELFDEARETFERIGAAAPRIEADGRAAALMLLRGKPDAALALAGDALSRVPAADRAAVHIPLLQRVRGAALWVLGDYSAATRALEAALQEARKRGADYEVAVTATLMRQLTGAAPEQTNAEAILGRLGVRAVPQMLPYDVGTGTSTP